jgi:hypothetical protein
MAIEALREYLRGLPSGPVPEPGRVRALLDDCWNELSMTDRGEMVASKLPRIESLTWHFPELKFSIERHGSFVLGSKSANIQRWTIDVVTGEASFHERSRLLVPPEKRLELEPLAEEISGLILNGVRDHRLSWTDDNSVRLMMGKILPKRGLASQTIVGRRKRLRELVKRQLAEANWSSPKTNAFVRNS